MTTPRLRRHDYLAFGRPSHAYTLDCNHNISTKRAPGNDPHRLTGVTTILNALPGPRPEWGAKIAAEYVLNEWDELAERPITERLDLITGAPDRYVTAAADRGTEIHGYAEHLVKGEPVDVPDELRLAVDKLAQFLDDWQIEPYAVEAPVALTPDQALNYGIGRLSFAGTLDLAARIGKRGGAHALFDIKTGSVQNKVGLQLAGYRFANLWQPNGPDSETEKRPDDIELTYVIHVQPDAVEMLPVTAGARELRALAYINQQMTWLQQHDWWFKTRGPEPLVGPAETPNGGTAA